MPRTVKAHVLKTDHEVFDATMRGLKQYEIRYDDRGFEVGDILSLRETLHTGEEMRQGAPLVYTGRRIHCTVAHIIRGPVYGLAEGWVLMSFNGYAVEFVVETTKAKEQLKRHEGYRQHPYMDSMGVMSVGIGRNLESVGIRQFEADILLEADYMDARVGAMELVSEEARMAMGEVRFAVLVNMCFNLGQDGLRRFRKMLAAVEQGDYEGAVREMYDSRWAHQVDDGPGGKLGRADELAMQMLTGEWGEEVE